MDQNPVIRLSNISRSFGNKLVLRSVSATVESGKVVGIMGRNGEGKTTLFKIMLDLLEADSGTVSILGMVPDGSGLIRQKVGYIPDHPSFHPFMDVQEVLKWRAAFFPTWDWKKAYKMSAELELDLKTPIKGASKGTLAKTAWVCAASHYPPVLMFDEPTSGLDPVVRGSVLKHFVSELSDEGKTIIVANHHMEELVGVLDEVWILAEGTIQERYALDDLRKNSVRITGRLKGAGAPARLKLYEENRTGDLVRWLTIDPETIEMIRKLDLLEPMQLEPLSLEQAFQLILQRKNAND